MMRYAGDVMAHVGDFKGADGKKVKRWARCGVAMRDARSGSLSIKLDTVPVGPTWSGWLTVRNVPSGGPDVEPVDDA